MEKITAKHLQHLLSLRNKIESKKLIDAGVRIHGRCRKGLQSLNLEARRPQLGGHRPGQWAAPRVLGDVVDWGDRHKGSEILGGGGEGSWNEGKSGTRRQ